MSNHKPEMGQFCWNELMTTDHQKARDFYSKLFGWQPYDHAMGPMTYTMFKSGDKDVMAGMMQIPEDKKGMPPHWMSYISVENVDASVEKAKALGATITMGATQVGDFGRFAILQDPTGAHIAIWESLKTGCC